MNKRNRTIFMSVAAIVILACACPVTGLPGGSEPTSELPTGPATFTPLNTAIPPIVPTVEQAPSSANALLADDFSSDSGEWESYSEDATVTEVRNGVYVLQSSSDTWAWAGTTSEFGDVVIEVDVTMSDGPSNYNIGLGVMCRLTDTGDGGSINGYLLAISADGYYYIGSIAGGSITDLVAWEFSDAINQGYETNSIRATCSGNELSLEANGELLTTTNTVAGGSEFGSIGFTVTSYESQNGEPIAEGEFDNLVVSEP